MVAAYISIISSVLFAIGLVTVRHLSKHNGFGWAMLVPALASFGGNVGCMAYAFVASARNGASENAASEVRFMPEAAGAGGEAGSYETGGKMFTREAWACMMDEYFHEREGEWAGKACDSFVSF